MRSPGQRPARRSAGQRAVLKAWARPRSRSIRVVRRLAPATRPGFHRRRRWPERTAEEPGSARPGPARQPSPGVPRPRAREPGEVAVPGVVVAKGEEVAVAVAPEVVGVPGVAVAPEVAKGEEVAEAEAEAPEVAAGEEVAREEQEEAEAEEEAAAEAEAEAEEAEEAEVAEEVAAAAAAAGHRRRRHRRRHRRRRTARSPASPSQVCAAWASRTRRTSWQRASRDEAWRLPRRRRSRERAQTTQTRLQAVAGWFEYSSKPQTPQIPCRQTMCPLPRVGASPGKGNPGTVDACPSCLRQRRPRPGRPASSSQSRCGSTAAVSGLRSGSGSARWVSSSS